MMATIYLLKYNNYYNRIVKREDTLNGYLTADSNYITVGNVNFIPNDWINTQQTVNISADTDIDYCLVENKPGGKFTRWFIINTNYNNWTQCTLTLHRDVTADYYNTLNSATCFIEKGRVPQTNDLIFNSENMTFNQIKQSELLLKDKSKCPWVCIYAARQNGEGQGLSYEFGFSNQGTLFRIFENEEAFNNWGLKKAADNKATVYGGGAAYTQMTIEVAFSNSVSNSNHIFRYFLRPNGNSSLVDDYYVVNSRPQNRWFLCNNRYDPSIVQGWLDELPLNEELALFTNGYDKTTYSDILSYNNSTIAVNTGNGYKYYKITMTSQQDNVLKNIYPIFNSTSGSLWSNVLQPLYKKMSGNDGETIADEPAVISYYTSARTVKYEDVTSSYQGGIITIPAERLHLDDAPYDMFCMPYSDDLMLTNSGDSNFDNIKSNAKLCMSIVSGLTTKYSGIDSIMDAQILPYCPLENFQVVGNTFNLNNNSTLAYTKIESSGGNTMGYIFHSTRSTFSDEIVLDKPFVINDFKVQSQTELHRLCSPNYNGVFEFNAAKNGGISVINYACTYKPYDPYIKLWPNWGRLYAANNSDTFKDARGLLCGGDYSLPMMTSAWESYQLQNKNYNVSFTAEIENLEFQNNVQTAKDAVSAVAGTAQAVASGIAAGGFMGGPVGAVIGGVVGGAASAAAGITDTVLDRQLRDKSIKLKKDQFGYELGNIKALPNTLKKVTAFNVDNKYFPFLEYYSCSEIETKALKNKIKYNGMTVMTIDNINTYIVANELTYVKGSIIKADINTDYHILNSLNEEFEQGLFIKQETTED